MRSYYPPLLNMPSQVTITLASDPPTTVTIYRANSGPNEIEKGGTVTFVSAFTIVLHHSPLLLLMCNNKSTVPSTTTTSVAEHGPSVQKRTNWTTILYRLSMQYFALSLHCCREQQPLQHNQSQPPMYPKLVLIPTNQ